MTKPKTSHPIFRPDDADRAAWQWARRITDSAIPTLLEREEQTWEMNFEMGDLSDQMMKLRWKSNVPGSFAPESIMLAAVQAKENMGYVVEDGLALVRRGAEALEADDMVTLNAVTTELWQRINEAKKDPTAPSHRYKRYTDWDDFEANARFPEKRPLTLTPEELTERMHAAWLGQIAGGALGTMIEGYTTDNIRERFGEVRDYLRKPETYNDDITYELAYLKTFETHGRALTSEQIALAWVGLVPAGWSAEDIALANLRRGIMPPESGRFGNPFCEWIGAQMRGVICGMTAPGDAREAARLAWLDGVISHEANGVLGEIFNAVMAALAFTYDDMRDVLLDAVELIPADSEYAAVLRFAREACEENDDWESAWRRCEERVLRYNWIHAYPNAMAEVVALWYGGRDFDEVSYIISMCGQDVDCNAAQILNVVATMVGREGIDARWTDPIGDTLETYLRVDRTLSIRELAERTAKVALMP